MRAPWFPAAGLLLFLSCQVNHSCRDEDASCSLPAYLLFLRSLSPLYAYVSNTGGSSISQYAVDAGSGQLSLITTTSVSPLSPYYFVFDPSQSFLYATGGASNFVGTFSIDSATGQITSKGNIAGANTYGISMSPDGRFLFAVLQAGNSIMIRSRDSTTGLLSGSGSTAITGTLPRGLTIDSQGRWLFVSDQTGGVVRAFTVDSAGNVTANGTVSATNVNFSAMGALDRFLYSPSFSTNQMFPLTVNQTTGVLTNPLGAVSTSPDTSPYVPALHPGGTLLYVIAQGTNSLRTYTVNSDGSLSFLGSTPTGSTPSWVRVDPSGKFVYVVNGGSNTIYTYRISASGLPVLTASAACGASANDIIFSSAYRF